MRIAISGSHRTGKSTLVTELATRLSGHDPVEEPYALMVEEGYEFSHPPALEDFVAQLERSISELKEAGRDVVFDRCPVDLLAYILVHEHADAFDLDEWFSDLREAVSSLDLIVFLPIETPDRITFADSDDDADSRRATDEKLHELLVEDILELGVEVLQVSGDSESRARAVLQRVRPARR